MSDERSEESINRVRRKEDDGDSMRTKNIAVKLSHKTAKSDVYDMMACAERPEQNTPNHFQERKRQIPKENARTSMTRCKHDRGQRREGSPQEKWQSRIE